MISTLAAITKLSPNHSGPRKYPLTRITPHCFVGQVTASRGLEVFLPSSRKASANYVIGHDGEIGAGVDENNRSWCSSSSDNDNRAVTIEIASDTSHPYAVTDAAWGALVDLCVDICARHGKKRLVWIPDKALALSYKPAADELQITVHRWFANKACPGDYIFNKLGQLADEVTKSLNKVEPEKPAKLYRVQVGAFQKKENAERMAAELRAKGYQTIIKEE